MTDIQALREELSNPAIGSNAHLRKIALSLLDDLEKEKGYSSAYEAEKWHYHGLAESEGERADRAEKRIEEEICRANREHHRGFMMACNHLKEHENVHYADAAEMEIAALRQRIAELETNKGKPVMFIDGNISASDAEKLAAVIREMGRRTSACITGGNGSLEVAVKQFDDFQIVHYGATEDYAKGYIDCQNNYNKALTAAGIGVKGE
ncbi:ead/Ea22-like family protein [Salmonella enterica subsp. enterica]|nr:ead/Ea22-like family protein [Salmonella enterica subsp. enterica serovar Alachua]EDU9873731.1 ead/Ea22-like family protein [Salmonella enterica subsp. enterica]EDC3935069.1 ead/Ea22-like family protein [Salmonella enterica subsp. enterica serovar Alachua]EDY7333974.1 ead/Ea22-like family protein [Salmonella enterica subsp. enterica serovar Alachua]EDZ7041622.1 ead/Ea22-like family protein [Salmonella enterica subsp. enterica serovar Alachua]